MDYPHENSYTHSRYKHSDSSNLNQTLTPSLKTPRPNPDVFNESSLLLSKKCRTSTPSSKIIPPRPPSKSVQRWIHKTRHSRIRRLDNHYEHVKKIGSGHFADVYSAKSLDNGQYYAIKKSRFPFQGRADRQRKLQEVRNHELLPPHENCVKYIKSWEEDGLLYIQTELCKTSLNEIIESAEDNKLPENVVWTYLVDLLLAVKHLHDYDLIHLDIKPENIFISFDNIAKLGDFGLMYDLKKGAIASTPNGLQDMNGSRYTSNNSHLNRNACPENKKPNKSQLNKVSKTNNNSFSCFGSPIEQNYFQQLISSSAMDHSLDNNGDINLSRSDDSDSIDEGDSKYLASETMQGKFTKAADIFSLGITIFEIASGMDLPKGGEVYHMLRHNQIDDSYFNGLSGDLIKVIKQMMEADYTKRPTINDILQIRKVQSMVTKRKLQTTYLTSLRSIRNNISFLYYLLTSAITLIMIATVNFVSKSKSIYSKVGNTGTFDRSRLTPDSNDGEVPHDQHLSPHSSFIVNSSSDSMNSSRICGPQRPEFHASDVSILDNSFGDDDLLNFDDYPSRRSSDTSIDDDHCFQKSITNSNTYSNMHDKSHSGSSIIRARPRNLLNLFEEIGADSRTA